MSNTQNNDIFEVPLVENKQQEQKQPESLKAMLKNINTISLPASIGMFLSIFIEMINQIYAGHMGDPAILAGIGIGNICINIVCITTAFGMNGAIETFVS